MFYVIKNKSQAPFLILTLTQITKSFQTILIYFPKKAFWFLFPFTPAPRYSPRHTPFTLTFHLPNAHRAQRKNHIQLPLSDFVFYFQVIPLRCSLGTITNPSSSFTASNELEPETGCSRVPSFLPSVFLPPFVSYKGCTRSSFLAD